MLFFFFFTAPATTEIYTLSLHDALPICAAAAPRSTSARRFCTRRRGWPGRSGPRSEEHTSELQSLTNLVCRLLLEKKKKKLNKTKRYKKRTSKYKKNTHPHVTDNKTVTR